eukprot:Rhum_TRINITY_DN15504_c5_g1::Rhum_TRINITY_DN15504_c5_g1_i1::g.160786::m.160786/K01674/cah; carbonic anhydrase
MDGDARQSRLRACPAATSLLIVLASVLAAADALEIKWTYHNVASTMRGPQDWGTAFPVCSAGRQQSPVDVPAASTPASSQPLLLSCTTPVSRVAVENTQYAVKVTPRAGGPCALRLSSDDAAAAAAGGNGGGPYQLDSLHFHAPSEHTVDGRRFDLEAHFVHAAKDGSLSVVGVLFDRRAPGGSGSALLEQLVGGAGLPRVPLRSYDALKGAFEKQAAVAAAAAGAPLERALPGGLRVEDAVYGGGGGVRYARYNGSLTTPPCSERVVWNLVLEPRHVTEAQLEAFKEAMALDGVGGGGAAAAAPLLGTARPVQPLNGRGARVHTPAAVALPRGRPGPQFGASATLLPVLVAAGVLAAVCVRLRHPLWSFLCSGRGGGGGGGAVRLGDGEGDDNAGQAMQSIEAGSDVSGESA